MINKKGKNLKKTKNLNINRNIHEKDMGFKKKKNKKEYKVNFANLYV